MTSKHGSGVADVAERCFARAQKAAALLAAIQVGIYAGYATARANGIILSWRRAIVQVCSYLVHEQSSNIKGTYLHKYKTEYYLCRLVLVCLVLCTYY